MITILQLVCVIPSNCLSFFYSKLPRENSFLIISIIFDCLQFSSFGIDWFGDNYFTNKESSWFLHIEMLVLLFNEKGLTQKKQRRREIELTEVWSKK